MASLSRSKRVTLLKVIADILEIVKSQNEVAAAKEKGAKKNSDLYEGTLAENDDAENDELNVNKNKNKVICSEPKTKRKKRRKMKNSSLKNGEKKCCEKLGKLFTKKL